MTTKLDEFSINLPMTGVTGVGANAPTAAPAPAYGYHDITAGETVPAEVAPQSFSHISVCVDSIPSVSSDSTKQMVTIDLVLNVSIMNSESGAMTSYKVVKRLSMDKIKLALSAEAETPYQVVEAETSETKAQKLAEEQRIVRATQAARRARELAGLPLLEQKWKVGDKVEVKASSSDAYGEKGVIEKVTGDKFEVKLGKRTASVYAKDLMAARKE